MEQVVQNRTWKRNNNAEPYQTDSEELTLALIVHLTLMVQSAVQEVIDQVSRLETALRRLYAILHVEDHALKQNTTSTMANSVYNPQCISRFDRKGSKFGKNLADGSQNAGNIQRIYQFNAENPRSEQPQKREQFSQEGEGRLRQYSKRQTRIIPRHRTFPLTLIIGTRTLPFRKSILQALDFIYLGPTALLHQNVTAPTSAAVRAVDFITECLFGN